MAKVDFQVDAYKEYIEAIRWYYQRDPPLAYGFQKSFDDAIALILEAPERWPVAIEDIRRVRMHRFPYIVYYYRVSVDLVRILALAHTSRKPLYWRKRR